MDLLSFISPSNRRRPDHAGGDVLHTVLPGARSGNDTDKCSRCATELETFQGRKRAISIGVISYTLVRFWSLGRALAMAMHAFS
jgi:hypothetical protein